MKPYYAVSDKDSFVYQARKHAKKVLNGRTLGKATLDYTLLYQNTQDSQLKNDYLMNIVYINMGGIVQIVNRLVKDSSFFDDAVQEAILGLKLGVERYKDAKDVKVWTYSKYWIQYYIQRYMGRKRKKLPMVALSEVDENSYEFCKELEEEVDYSHLTPLLNRIPDHILCLIKSHFVDGISWKDLAQKQGVHRYTMSNSVGIHIKKIREIGKLK